MEQQSITLTIREERLQQAVITVTAESTAEIVLHTPLANSWYALLVDDQHYNLVMWKHVAACPEIEDALDHVLAQVLAAIARLQTPPTPAFDRAVAGALERLAAENAQSARTARYAGIKDDAKFFQRAANSYVRALSEWLAGTRPERTSSGNWLLPSRSGGAAHLLTLDGDWICSCSSGTQIHWASALIIGLEVAQDDVERFDDGDDSEMTADDPEPPTPAPVACSEDARRSLITRLCAARARLLAA